MIRNVANLVPPMEEEGTFHGTSASLEFAVLGLDVPNIIVLGHAHCGGIHAMIRGEEAEQKRVQVRTRLGVDLVFSAPPGFWQQCLTQQSKRRNVRVNAMLSSFRWKNLTTFPWIRERMAAKTLKLHGWFFDIETAQLEIYNSKVGHFENRRIVNLPQQK